MHAAGIRLMILDQIRGHRGRTSDKFGSESLELLDGFWLGVGADRFFQFVDVAEEGCSEKFEFLVNLGRHDGVAIEQIDLAEL